MDDWTYDLEDEPRARGGQADVYFGTRSDGYPVAVKIATGRAIMSLEHEVRMLRSFAEANVQGVVRCIDTLHVPSGFGMVMPRFESHLGEWLKRVTTEQTQNTLDDILHKMATLARILASVHRVQVGDVMVVHRDVKPENVFVDKDERLFLGDFGGAMAISGLAAVELAMFGTPMWAPLDQILPGRTIPDPTWDTYSLCVLVYGALTGSRPAYQADPEELLTARGKELWGLAKRAILADGDNSRTLRAAFAQERTGTAPADIVNVTGRSALIESDQTLLDEKIAHLVSLTGASVEQTRLLKRGLWSLLCRGLSPLSHPSPPNRYRNADELAEQLEDLRDLLHSEAPTAKSSSDLGYMLGPGVSAPDIPIDTAPPSLRPVSTMSLWPIFLLIDVLIATPIPLWINRDMVWDFWAVYTIPEVPARTIELFGPFDSGAGRGPADLVGHVVQAKGNTVVFDGLTAPTLHFMVRAAATNAVLELYDSTGRLTSTLTLPAYSPGPGSHTWEATAAKEMNPGVYRFKFRDTGFEPRIQGEVTATSSSRSSNVIVNGQAVSIQDILSVKQEIQVPPLRLDACEVSYDRWDDCVDAGVCAPLNPTNNRQLPVPIAQVDDAEQFCTWAGGRLPTQAEWISAAGDTTFPWGEALPTCNHAIGRGCGDSAHPVCATPMGASPEGIIDLAGNMREWVWSTLSPSDAVLLGGSYLSTSRELENSSIALPLSDSPQTDAGFRCAYDSLK